MIKQISTRVENLPPPIFKSGFHGRNVLLIISIVLLLVVMLRFDFVYSGKSQEIKSGDTLWGYLESEVFQHAGVTRASISHLKKQGVNVNLILRNKDFEGGDLIAVKNKQLIITGPNDQIRVKAQVLPEFALRNHFYQVIAYDFVILVVFLYLGGLIYDLKTTHDPKIIYEQVGIVLIITVIIPFAFILTGALIGNLYLRFFYSSPIIQRLPDGASVIYDIPDNSPPSQYYEINNYAGENNVELKFLNKEILYPTVIPVKELQKNH